MEKLRQWTILIMNKCALLTKPAVASVMEVGTWLRLELGGKHVVHRKHLFSSMGELALFIFMFKNCKRNYLFSIAADSKVGPLLTHLSFMNRLSVLLEYFSRRKSLSSS